VILSPQLSAFHTIGPRRCNGTATHNILEPIHSVVLKIRTIMKIFVKWGSARNAVQPNFLYHSVNTGPFSIIATTAQQNGRWFFTTIRLHMSFLAIGFVVRTSLSQLVTVTTHGFSPHCVTIFHVSDSVLLPLDYRSRIGYHWRI
jgi:hypothetical protein